MEAIKDRDYVDKEHVITNEKGNVRLYFMKESKGDVLGDVQAMLMDAFENRVCKNI